MKCAANGPCKRVFASGVSKYSLTYPLSPGAWPLLNAAVLRVGCCTVWHCG